MGGFSYPCFGCMAQEETQPNKCCLHCTGVGGQDANFLNWLNILSEGESKTMSSHQVVPGLLVLFMWNARILFFFLSHIKKLYPTTNVTSTRNKVQTWFQKFAISLVKYIVRNLHAVKETARPLQMVVMTCPTFIMGKEIFRWDSLEEIY